MNKIIEGENPFTRHFGILKKMDAFATVGAASVSIGVVSVCVLSFLFMSAIIAEFLHIQSKRVNLLKALRSERAGEEFKQGRILMWAYIVVTIALVCGTLFLYFVRLIA